MQRRGLSHEIPSPISQNMSEVLRLPHEAQNGMRKVTSNVEFKGHSAPDSSLTILFSFSEL